MDPIITIGREYGSGGREIGKLVADKLAIPFYDKEILTRAAEESGLCHELWSVMTKKTPSAACWRAAQARACMWARAAWACRCR